MRPARENPRSEKQYAGLASRLAAVPRSPQPSRITQNYLLNGRGKMSVGEAGPVATRLVHYYNVPPPTRPHIIVYSIESGPGY